MNEQEFEYRLDPSARHIVQIRAARTRYGRGMGWRVYHHADSPSAAERILALLVSDQEAESMVRE